MTLYLCLRLYVSMKYVVFVGSQGRTTVVVQNYTVAMFIVHTDAAHIHCITVMTEIYRPEMIGC
jgi:hypothetical protein